jgi:peptide/nickel transport system permease protein
MQSTPFQRVMRRAMRSPQFLIGALLVALFVLIAFFGPSIAPYAPTAQKMADRLKPPSELYLLGTDNFGRDNLSRMLHGSLPSLLVGVLSVVFSLAIGGAIGLIAGYRGGSLDTALMSVMDVLFAYPAVLLAIALLAVLGPRLQDAFRSNGVDPSLAGLVGVILAIGIVNLPTFARLTRGSTLASRELLYVESARALGVSPVSIALRHILPNILAPVIVQTSLTIAAAVLIEASLSYLGLGIQPPSPSWGNILAGTYDLIQTNPWPSLFAGAAIALAVLGFNLLGDGLRDALDPTTR